MSTGFRVFTKRPLPPQDVIDAYKALPAANVSDCMNRFGALPASYRLLSRRFDGSVAGPALTVQARSGDNLMIHKALNLSQPGDFIVVANSGDISRAIYGGIMHGYAKFKNIGGLIIDGPVRDIDTLYDMGIPVYALGTTPGGPYKEGPGEVNAPIALGGVRVCPGDIVLADNDGVIIIPSQEAEALLPIAQKFSQTDHAKAVAALNGTADRSWIEKSLVDRGCEIIDSTWR